MVGQIVILKARPGEVKISQILTISVDRLGKKPGQVSPEDLDQILDGLQELIT